MKLARAKFITFFPNTNKAVQITRKTDVSYLQNVER